MVELNLRLPSMLHGKKGFERIVWAFKNVLSNAVTWLFYDFDVKTCDSDQGKAAFHVDSLEEWKPFESGGLPLLRTILERYRQASPPGQNMHA